MTPSQQSAYAQYRMEKAEEAYETAELLVANSKWNAAVNRLYYAAYYAVSGLLAKTGIESKTHAGVKTQFLLHFIKTERISIERGKLYADLFDWRQKGDYGDFFDFTEADVLLLMNPVRTLIDAVI
ncbi:MAG: HEPN domain-containing protein, partial [Saprospiraceae bacterium]|nr:HEPN domain-containing protein [Saprospiraceae bacterium]